MKTTKLNRYVINGIQIASENDKKAIAIYCSLCDTPIIRMDWKGEIFAEDNPFSLGNNVDVVDVEEANIHLDDQEKVLIVKALEASSGNRKEAAARLGISERTMYRKMKEYNL